MGPRVPSGCAKKPVDAGCGDSQSGQGRCRFCQHRKDQRVVDLGELERRISAALERIGRGLERSAAGPSDTGTLQAALDEERVVNAQLTERIRALRERDQAGQGGLQGRVEKLTRQLDVQGLELQRMRKTAIQLREQVRMLLQAQTDGLSDPHLINKSMLVELEALRATRQTEIAEMDEILAELAPMLSEVHAHA